MGGRKIVFNRSGKYGKDTGTAEAALQALQEAEAGQELYLAGSIPGGGKLFEQKTDLRDRPLWRFFPSRDGEWVLWRWQDFHYDTSTRGDYRIGWHRNNWQRTAADKLEFNVKGTPWFYKAEQFRHSYHDPEKVTETLMNWRRTGQAKSTFADIEPPDVELAWRGPTAPPGSK